MNQISFSKHLCPLKFNSLCFSFFFLILFLWLHLYILIYLIIIWILIEIILNLFEENIIFDCINHRIQKNLSFLGKERVISRLNLSDYWDFDFTVQRGFTFQEKTGEGDGRIVFDHLHFLISFIKSHFSRKIRRINLSIKRKESEKLYNVLSLLLNFYRNPVIEEKFTEFRLNIEGLINDTRKNFSFQAPFKPKNHRIEINENRRYFLRCLLNRKFKVQDAKLISLKGLGLKYIPSLRNVIDLSEVEVLDLSWNNITKIENLGDYPKLKILNLSHNLLTKIENLTYLPQLEKIYLNSNLIQKIENLEELRSLRFLFLGDNQIADLADIEHLDRLEYLYLDRNRLIKINCDNLPARLIILNLCYNNVSISNLERLKNLNELIMDNSVIKDADGSRT